MIDPVSTTDLDTAIELLRSAAEGDRSHAYLSRGEAAAIMVEYDMLRDWRAKNLLARFRADKVTPETPTAHALTPLANFGARCLDEMRQDGGGDIDGGWAQDVAVECGLLHWVDVTEPCNPDSCACAGYGDFPQKCLRFTDAAKAADVPVTQQDLDEADAYADRMLAKFAKTTSPTQQEE